MKVSTFPNAKSWNCGFRSSSRAFLPLDRSALTSTNASPGFWTDLYLSGTTFFTLGLGDVIPRTGLARALVVAEGGFGFGFLAAIIGYLPVIYNSFSQREVNISLLDSRAGTPPTAGELLRRHDLVSQPRAASAQVVSGPLREAIGDRRLSGC